MSDKPWIPRYLDRCGVPMESALDLHGCRIVGDFLGCVEKLSDKKDIARLMKGYREYISGHKGSENVG